MTYHDQIGNTLHFKQSPKRIISLVPSQSEFLWDLGLGADLIGITKFCVHPPEMFKSLARIGGTKELNLDKIRALAPELIIGNKEENDALQIATLQKEFNVWISDIVNFKGTYEMMQSLGKILNREEAALKITNDIHRSLDGIQNILPPLKVAYFIWNKPYMLAANSTFIHFVLTDLGLTNVVGQFERYPVFDEQQLKALNPDLCFLSSEPFPFNSQHAAVLQEILPNAKMIQVDGEMFSWYGTRLKYLAAYVDVLKHQLI
ncbi:MAG: helical backbone metal receptor [Bacteroidota bacterium]